MKFKEYLNEGNDSLKVQKKKIGDNESEFYCKGIKIATLKERMDLVKARSTDNLRTKLSKVHEFVWDKEGLKKFFGKDNIKTGSDHGWNMSMPKMDFWDNYGRGAFRTGDVVVALNSYAKANDIPMSFR